MEMLSQCDIDLLVELSPTNLTTGEPGLSCIRWALQQGIPVVTANKGPLVLAYQELIGLAKEREVGILFGGTVAGALPVVNMGMRDLSGCLVERVEGFATELEWKRAYREINHFERQLVDFGTILFKFWIHIGRDEQLRRFEGRKDIDYKAWKLTDEDWRNREKWDQYQQAVDEMLLKTSTLTAPWTIVEGNCKWYARIKVLKTLVDGLSHELNYTPLAEIPTDTEKGGKKKGKKKKKSKKTEMTEATSLSETPLPMIDQFEYGTIVIDGQTYESDVIIFPDGAVERWEHKDEHVLRPTDVNRVIEAKPETVIIGLGTVGNMKMHPKAEKCLQEAGIDVMVHRTNKACETYKELRTQRKVAAILHITC